MRFGILGPLTVSDPDGPVVIRGLMPRTVLAVLLLHANSPVSTDHLINVLWGEKCPGSAASSLHNHVMRLRRMLGAAGGARVQTVIFGYQIQVRPGELDLDDFAAFCAVGRAAGRDGQWGEASRALAAALALWRGGSVGDLPDLVGHEAQIQQLLESRIQAVEGRIEADLELGRHREAVSELRALTADHPLREAFHEQLMLALYRSDLRAEAIDAFRRLRRSLVDELGVEPAVSVRQLYRRILEADPDLAVRARVRTGSSAASSVPVAGTGGGGGGGGSQVASSGYSGARFQLPADTRVFTGRAHELEQLIALAREAQAGTSAGMVVISAIDGMAGIGKSTLAVHAAHRMREQFPDGQLFLDLHGHTTGLEPMAAGDALDWLLRSLGVPPETVPQEPQARAAAYRDRLDGTRTLIILDNASSSAQVRTLLPASPGCLVLVTSRKRLTGLDDAHLLGLDILSDDEAISLLHQVAGPGRIPADHPLIHELAALCGNLPLAIRIIAARLRHHRALRIEDFIEQLRNESLRLEHIQDEDHDLTAVFDLSYQHLTAAEQRLFRLLGLIPGSDLDACAAANLAGAGRRDTERLLESLLDHNLLVQQVPGRFRFHDLVRLYARTLTNEDQPGERDAATARLLDYYQHTAYAADQLLTRRTRSGSVPAGAGRAAPAPAAAPGLLTAAPDLPDRAAALAWLRTERGNLLAAAAHFTARGQHPRVIALTAALAGFLQQEGPWPQAAALHLAAATAARELSDRQNEANALSNLGRVRYLSGEYPAATESLNRALAICQDLDDRQGTANTLSDLGRILRMIGDFTDATKLLTEALAIYHDLDDRQGEANIRFEMGRGHYLVGDYPAAIDLLGQALVLFKASGDRQSEANTLSNLGQTRHATGDYPAAADLHRRALTIHQDLGTRLGEANALSNLGRVLQATGDHPAAAGLHQQALAIYRDLGTRLGEANALANLGQARCSTGDYATAGELHEQALALYRALNDRQGEAESFISLGALAAESTGPQEARVLYLQALRLAREIRSLIDEARSLEGAARAAAGAGDHATALPELRQAVAIYQRIGAAEAGEAAACLAVLEDGDRQQSAARESGI
jgi:DNA-binding SARP family transcriptional activator/tetratricopeptide (TPR) repeat protein